jgi:hypothetical protein
MPKHPAMPDDTVHDETVRMRPDGAERPSPDAVRPSPVEEADDTRPVTRDWLLGAPDSAHRDAAPATPTPVPQDDAPAAGDDDSTRALDLADPGHSAAETAPVAPLPETGAGPEGLSTQEGPSVTDTPDGPPPGDEPPAVGPRGH